MKINSSDALASIRQEALKALSVREQSNETVSEEAAGLEKGTPRMQILCCGGTGCKASESARIVENFRALLQEKGIADKVDVVVPGCFGFCEKGPIVKIIPDNTFYTSVRPADVEEIVTSHIIGGQKVERLLYKDPGTGEHISDSKHMNFYRKQMRIALRNCGFINPEDIREYIARDGYKALAAPDSPRGSSGRSPASSTPPTSMSCATPTRVTRAPSWTVPSWKAIPTPSSRR